MNPEDQLNESQMSGLFEAPIPGESLTTDPDSPAPYETPPEYTKVEDFVDALFMRVSDEDNLDKFMDPIRKGTPIEDVAGMILFQAFSSGKITPDLQLMAVEPTIYMLIGLSQFVGIEDAELYPEEPFALSESEEIGVLEGPEGENKPEKAPDIKDMKAPQGMSRSLISQIKKQEI